MIYDLWWSVESSKKLMWVRPDNKSKCGKTQSSLWIFIFRERNHIYETILKEWVWVIDLYKWFMTYDGVLKVQKN